MNPAQRQARLDLSRLHPLDLTIQYPPRREYFQSRFRAEPSWTNLRHIQECLLYLHVPFCAQRCHYCNFSVDARADENLRRRYVDGLIRELEGLEGLLAPAVRIPGIDIGGGTPTALSAFDLARLLCALGPWRDRCTRPRPLSIETTPEIAATEPERLRVLVDGGVQRSSVGIQSTQGTVLREVNRSTPRDTEERALANLHQAGFERINVDLIFGLPHQSVEAWRHDLERVIALNPDSITTYDCLYRGKGRSLTRRTREMPNPEDYGRLYDLGWELLRSHGFHAPYGSVNFSKHGGETGTSAYFEGRLLDGLPYLGLGNYAASWFDDAWCFAPAFVDRWLERLDGGDLFPVGDYYRLPRAERATKQALLSLSFGLLDPDRFKRAFMTPLAELHGPSIEVAVELGLLRWEPEQRVYRIPHGSFRAMPLLRALFYTDEAVEWVLASSRK